MIVIYKETMPDNNIPLDMPTMELIETIKNGRIQDELDRIRNEYGDEIELIKGKYSDDVCIVYADVKWYVMKV